MRGSTHLLEMGIKKLAQPQQRAAFDCWLIGRSDIGAHGVIEHPRGNPAGGVVWQSDIHHVSEPSSRTENFDLQTKKWVIRIAYPQ
jgi:hypothetical protein